MKEIIWALIPCPNHIQHVRQQITDISSARNGCHACRIRLTCTACAWTSRHAVWSSAVASEHHHQESRCLN